MGSAPFASIDFIQQKSRANERRNGKRRRVQISIRTIYLSAGCKVQICRMGLIMVTLHSVTCLLFDCFDLFSRARCSASFASPRQRPQSAARSNCKIDRKHRRADERTSSIKSSPLLNSRRSAGEMNSRWAKQFPQWMH